MGSRPHLRIVPPVHAIRFPASKHAPYPPNGEDERDVAPPTPLARCNAQDAAGRRRASAGPDRPAAAWASRLPLPTPASPTLAAAAESRRPDSDAETRMRSDPDSFSRQPAPTRPAPTPCAGFADPSVWPLPGSPALTPGQVVAVPVQIAINVRDAVTFAFAMKRGHDAHVGDVLRRLMRQAPRGAVGTRCGVHQIAHAAA